MNLKTYIKFKLEKCGGKTSQEQYKLLNDMYNELEQKGFTREVVFATTNEIITENLKKAREELDKEK